MADYEALFAKADTDLKDANERYSQAAADSMDAAFRGLVFGCAAEGVTEIELEPSDQGDYMSINELTAPDDVDVDTLMEDLWNFASDLTDYPDAPWRILAGVTVPTERGDYTVTIDVKVAVEGLADLTEPDKTVTASHDLAGKTIASVVTAEVQAFDTYKDEVTIERTTLTFTDGTEAVFGEVQMDLYTNDN